MAAPTQRGITQTARVGCAHVLPNLPEGMIVRSASPRAVGDSYEEAGPNGTTGLTIDWDNGFDSTITVVEDTGDGKSAPWKGDVLNSIHPGTGATVKCDVRESSKNNNSKGPGEVTFVIRYRPDRDAGDVTWPTGTPAP